ncbi:MAG TPA: hypothetical protein VM368_01885, partial [Flavisolibacter sp.]|nr:hypothetical protein [Flavisolibacter sp.]
MKRVLLPLLLLSSSAFAQIEPRKGILLETLYFQDAEKVLTPDAVVVISIGAAAKQHGYHLPLNTDFLQAEFFKTNIALKRNV